IVGESGTGRRHVARVMHDLGPEPDAEFVHVVCAEDPAPGRLHRRGTVYLDQSQLLSSEHQRLWLGWGERAARGEPAARGSGSSTQLSETQKQGFLTSLHSALAERSMRLRVTLPRLVDRLEDLPELCAHLIEQHAVNLGRPRIELEPAALEKLRGYPWPGNVR